MTFEYDGKVFMLVQCQKHLAEPQNMPWTKFRRGRYLGQIYFFGLL